jgi:hypothetical protein
MHSPSHSSRLDHPNNICDVIFQLNEKHDEIRKAGRPVTGPRLALGTALLGACDVGFGMELHTISIALYVQIGV